MQLLKYYFEGLAQIVFWGWPTENWKCASRETLSHDSELSVLNVHFTMRNIEGRWVSRLFTIDHKPIHVTLEVCLTLFNHNPDTFLQTFITVNKLGSTQLSKDRADVEIIPSFGRIGAKKTQCESVDQRNHRDRFLKCTQSNPHPYTSKRNNDQ